MIPIAGVARNRQGIYLSYRDERISRELVFLPPVVDHQRNLVNREESMFHYRFIV